MNSAFDFKKKHHSKKSFNDGSSRWVDSLLTYQFKLEDLSGEKRGLVVCISRNPYQPVKSVSKFDDKS